jgi:hypothetical protein
MVCCGTALIYFTSDKQVYNINFPFTKGIHFLKIIYLAVFVKLQLAIYQRYLEVSPIITCNNPTYFLMANISCHETNTCKERSIKLIAFYEHFMENHKSMIT